MAWCSEKFFVMLFKKIKTVLHARGGMNCSKHAATTIQNKHVSLLNRSILRNHTVGGGPKGVANRVGGAR